MVRPVVRRRAFAEGLGALGGLAWLGLGGCNCAGEARPDGVMAADPTDAGDGWDALRFAPDADQPDGSHALVHRPAGAAALPVVVALHGRGEAGRGLEAGARGFRDDYGVARAMNVLATPPVEASDVGGLLDAGRLAAISEAFTRVPYRGVVLVCPYTVVPGADDRDADAPFGRFVRGSLLARVGELRGAPVDRAVAGIDGISMGGRWALLIGLGPGRAFASVGAMQPAIREHEATSLAERAARAAGEGPLALRLATSEEDPFRGPTEALSRELDRRAVRHQLVVTRGPHDYSWNRDVGGVELLSFHERALRGLPAP